MGSVAPLDTQKGSEACLVGHHLPTPWVSILLGHPEKYKRVTRGRHKQAIIINLYLSLTDWPDLSLIRGNHAKVGFGEK